MLILSLSADFGNVIMSWNGREISWRCPSVTSCFAGRSCLILSALQRKGTRQVEEHDALLFSTVALVSCSCRHAINAHSVPVRKGCFLVVHSARMLNGARLYTVHSSTQRMLSHITSATLSEDRPDTLHYSNSSPDDPRHANSCELSVLRAPPSQGQN